MEPNQLKARALIIGKQLARLEWYNMTAQEADDYCQQQAESMGTTNPDDKQQIALLAMQFVIHGQTLTIG